MRSTRLLTLLAAVPAILTLSSCTSKKDSLKVYDLGARVEAGHLVYTILETQWMPQMGAGDNARVPKNRFFLVRISAVNSGSEELMVPNMTLEDDQGDAVEELSDGEQVPQWVGYIRKVKPADSISGNIVFDAEPKHYRLRVRDEENENGALVDLPLNFNGEAPQVPGASSDPPPITPAPTKK